MTLEYKDIIDEFIKEEDCEIQKSTELALEKLDDLLDDFFTQTFQNFSQIAFKTNLIGDYAIGSNYLDVEPIHFLIEYFVSNENYSQGEKYNKKGDIGKLLQSSFNFNTEIAPTIDVVLNNLYNFLSLRLPKSSVYIRKNAIYIKFLGKLFVISLEKKNFSEKRNIFILKGINYDLNIFEINANLLQKNKETSGRFFDLVRLYKVVENELKLFNNLLFRGNKILYFYENLLYNIPNGLFCENVTESLLNSVFYLKNVDKDILINAEGEKLIDDNYKLFAKSSCTSLDLDKVIAQTQVFINNIDKILAIKD